MPSVLAAFAHPDDAEFLCAGTLKLLADRGWRLTILTLCGGDLGSAVLSRARIRAVRLAEGRRAAATLGGDYRTLGLDDFSVAYGAVQLRRVTGAMRAARPDVVITHSPACYLLDHEETAKLARMACFAAPVPHYRTPGRPLAAVPALYYADALEGRDGLGRPVDPQFRVDVTSTFAARQTALACHASQREWLRRHHGVDEYLAASDRQAAVNGTACGVRYAEGFRQHLGHGYPRRNLLAEALPGLVRPNPGYHGVPS